MDFNNITFINDGQLVDEYFVNHWNISDYCDVYNKKITISFVGVVIYKEKVLFSFPKHYAISGLEQNEKLECMREILRVLAKKRVTKGSFDTKAKKLNDEFPLRAYIQVANYYRRYGLYHSTEKITYEGYNGRINWNKTINRANKIFQDNNILFYPFIINKVGDKDVFLSECMDYVLGDASRYQPLMDKIIMYKPKMHNRVFSNMELACSQLKQIKSNYFKDSEKKLIDSLLEYLTWKSQLKDNMRMLTLKFERYWEEMIMVYLNNHFVGMNGDSIIFEEDSEANFYKPGKQSVESKETEERLRRLAYKVEYDHFMKQGNTIYIFDSKYFNQVSELNYKQLFYHYQLMQMYPDSIIVNGLLLPTEKEYFTKAHVDRSDLDNIKITEHYINLRDVLTYYLKQG